MNDLIMPIHKFVVIIEKLTVNAQFGSNLSKKKKIYNLEILFFKLLYFQLFIIP